MKKALMLLALAPLCSACTGSLLESKLPVNLAYVLASAPSASSSTPLAADLAIGRPNMAPGLDSERIAVVDGRQLDYYRGARWGGRSADVVQTLLVDSWQDQQLFRSVTAEQARVSADYMLDIDVRDFQAEQGGGAPQVNVQMVGRLIRIIDRRLVGTYQAQAQVAASEERMGAVVAAFESAAQRVALDLAAQAHTAVAADLPALTALRGTASSD